MDGGYRYGVEEGILLLEIIISEKGEKVNSLIF